MVNTNNSWNTLFSDEIKLTQKSKKSNKSEQESPLENQTVEQDETTEKPINLGMLFDQIPNEELYKNNQSSSPDFFNFKSKSNCKSSSTAPSNSNSNSDSLKSRNTLSSSLFSSPSHKSRFNKTEYSEENLKQVENNEPRSTLKAIKWNRAKTSRSNGIYGGIPIKPKPLNNSYTNSFSQPKSSSNTEIRFGNNKALRNMYRRIQTRDRFRDLENKTSMQKQNVNQVANYDLGFQKLATRQNVTSDSLDKFESHNGFAKSEPSAVSHGFSHCRNVEYQTLQDRDLNIPNIPNPNHSSSTNKRSLSSSPSSRSSLATSSPYPSASTENTEQIKSSVFGLKSFQLSSNSPFGKQQNSPSIQNLQQYDKKNGGEQQISPLTSRASSLISQAANYSPLVNNSPLVDDGSQFSPNLQFGVNTAQYSFPAPTYQYSQRFSPNVERSANQNNYNNFSNTNRYPAYQESYAPSFPRSGLNANRPQNYGFRDTEQPDPYNRNNQSYQINSLNFGNSTLQDSRGNHRNSYDNQYNNQAYNYPQTQIQPNYHQNIPVSYPNSFPQNSYFQPPNLVSRIQPLRLENQMQTLNQATQRIQNSKTIRQILQEELTYPEPQSIHQSETFEMRKSFIQESLNELSSTSPVKMQLLEVLSRHESLSEIDLWREMKKLDRYIGTVALGLMMFHLIEEFGSDMIQRVDSDGRFTYSLSDDFKNLIKKESGL